MSISAIKNNCRKKANYENASFQGHTHVQCIRMQYVQIWNHERNHFADDSEETERRFQMRNWKNDCIYYEHFFPLSSVVHIPSIFLWSVFCEVQNQNFIHFSITLLISCSRDRKIELIMNTSWNFTSTSSKQWKPRVIRSQSEQIKLINCPMESLYDSLSATTKQLLMIHILQTWHIVSCLETFSLGCTYDLSPSAENWACRLRLLSTEYLIRNS